MHKLPPELHHYICESACVAVEGAASIHALNTVSTYFHEVSKPYLYRTVAASGVQQILALSERLAIVPPHLCRIDHLFLSNMPCQSKSNASTTHTEDSHKLLRCVVQILAHASPTLQTFSLFSQSPISTALIAKVFRTSFPILRRLSVHGFYPFLSSPKRFPQLEYLHLNGNRNPSGLFQMWTLEDACPALKTLRITGLNSAGSFVSEVEDAMKSSGADDDAFESTDDDLSSSRLPSQLKSLIVQAGPAPDPGLGKVASLKDNVMMDGLEGLRSNRTGGLSVRLSVPERTLRSLSARDMKDEWFTGISFV